MMQHPQTLTEWRWGWSDPCKWQEKSRNPNPSKLKGEYNWAIKVNVKKVGEKYPLKQFKAHLVSKSLELNYIYKKKKNQEMEVMDTYSSK